MRIVSLILEDNWDKVEKLLMKEEIKTRDFYCSKFASDMMDVISRNSAFNLNYVLYVDGELPGGINGVAFLAWVIRHYKSFVKEVKIISYHPGLIHEMQDLCKAGSLPFEVLR